MYLNTSIKLEGRSFTSGGAGAGTVNSLIISVSNMDLALKQENFDLFSTTGIYGVMALEAPPGTYRMRVFKGEERTCYCAP